MPRLIVNAKLLKGCKLWAGSLEEGEFRFGGLTPETVLRKITSLESCDDRTPNEEEYLKALKATLNQPSEAP